MTIRFTCSGCGSLLKIKEELAGTDGKCPKCKTEFVVPSPESEAESEEIEVAKAQVSKADVAESRGKSEKPVKAATKSKKTAASGDDFDPADFLMDDGDGDGGSRKADKASNFDAEEREKFGSQPSTSKSGKQNAKSSTPAAHAEPSGNASSFAKEMMMKAMEESRTHASEAPAEADKDGFDYSGMFRELGLKGGGLLVAIVVLGIGMYFVVDYMMGGGIQLPKLAYVSGTVTLDGQPLPDATVYFEPKNATIDKSGSKERPRTSLGKTDEKGHYTMYYIDKTQGVAIAKCRVWLSCVGPNGDLIPADHSEGTLVIKDVVAGKHEIPFNMVSQPK